MTQAAFSWVQLGRQENQFFCDVHDRLLELQQVAKQSKPFADLHAALYAAYSETRNSLDAFVSACETAESTLHPVQRIQACFAVTKTVVQDKRPSDLLKRSLKPHLAAFLSRLESLPASVVEKDGDYIESVLAVTVSLDEHTPAQNAVVQHQPQTEAESKSKKFMWLGGLGLAAAGGWVASNQWQTVKGYIPFIGGKKKRRAA